MPEATQRLIESSAKLGITMSDAQARALIRLLDELDVWNEKVNLTAIRERPQQITKHLLDSLSVHVFLRGSRIADMGTGAGFPGLPLACVNPDKHFTLLDSTAKKLKFVDHAAALLDLQNVSTVHTRAEAYKPKERFDTVIARAVGPVNTFIEWCGHLCASSGRLLAMKGRYPEEELRDMPSGWKLVAVHRLDVPGLEEERHLVEICRSHERL